MAHGTPVPGRQDQSVAAGHGAMSPVKLGFIGCGHVSGEYFESCALYREVEVLACADLVRSRPSNRRKGTRSRRLGLRRSS